MEGDKVSAIQFSVVLADESPYKDDQMVKQLLAFLLLILVTPAGSSTDQDYRTRLHWVGELKIFLLDLESKNSELLISNSRNSILNKISLFNQAIASGNYDCFFAGWPSTLVKSGGKRFCQNPSKGNLEYQNGNCKIGQLQCQPMIFGKDLCVGFSSQKDKQMAFASCDKKFNKKGGYDFLKSMTSDEKAALKEISILAHDVCISGTVGIQKSKSMCNGLIKKFKGSLNAIERAPAAQLTPEKTLEICEPTEVVDQKITEIAPEIIQVVNHNSKSTYEDLKNDFLSSPLCEPDKVLNDPKEKLSPILFKQLIEDMRYIVKTDTFLTREIKVSRFKEIATEYELSSDTIKYGEDLLNKYQNTNEGRFDAMARLRGVMLQEMDKISKSKKNYRVELIKDELLKRKIFTEDADGYSQCPFVSEDAFREALAGREAILKTSHKNKITDPNIITIIDYSRPSNERRMFVIDIKTKKVLHNTWVAHGGGKDRSQTGGVDGLGSSPQTSNLAGSFLSSEGFYIAKAPATGATFLNNVTLEGIDQNNKSMASRAIVVHGWRTPNHEYVNKTWVMTDSKKRLPGVDIYKNFMQTDFKTTQEDLFNLTQEVTSAATARDQIDSTEGCLGVPDTQMGHADRKGRNKSQLELLREDLPGTLMFNYTGPGKTKSQYL